MARRRWRPSAKRGGHQWAATCWPMRPSYSSLLGPDPSPGCLLPPARRKGDRAVGTPGEHQFLPPKNSCLFPSVAALALTIGSRWVGEKRGFPSTSKPDFEMPPPLIQRLLPVWHPHNVRGHSEPARLLQLRHLNHAWRWDGAKGGQARIGLDELDVHPVLYSGGEKVTVEMWVEGRQRPSHLDTSPRPEAKCRNRSRGREEKGKFFPRKSCR